MEVIQINNLDELKQLFEKTLENKEKKLRTALSGKPLVYYLGNTFTDYYMQERTKNNIFLQSLRFSQENVDKSNHQDYTKFNKEVRSAPKEEQIDASIIIWDTTVAIFDTENKKGVIINDKAHSEALKSWFDDVWMRSQN